ncbi:MAG TPA: TadE/TadG family type IV pilus assembly protein [Gemmataceae bacterium]|jgi:Flp pilus assembly protein TadG
MMIRRATPVRRRGATAVEFAAVLSVFLLFLFSVFEYGRFVMMSNLLINATREGCRYALVHSQDATVVADVQGVVRSRLAGQVNQLPDLNIQVYPTNNPAAALNTTNPDDPITVMATGTMTSLFPKLPYLPNSFTLRSSSVMTCEGN